MPEEVEKNEEEITREIPAEETIEPISSHRHKETDAAEISSKDLKDRDKKISGSKKELLERVKNG